MVSPHARREQVNLACERGLSQRRACGLIGVSRSSLSYELRLPPKDAPVMAAMKALSAQYPRYGYRRIRIFLRRQGFELSCSRAHRLWRQAGLLLPKKRPRRRIAAGRPRASTPFKANTVWAYDFVFDTTAGGQQIKCLTIIDEYTRECLAIDVAGSTRSKRVIEVLARLVSLRGAPLFLRSDNGPEFVSQAILEWISHTGIATALSDPGKPWQNGADESFNGKFRDECLSLEWFRSRREAAVTIEAWRHHYNDIRPHSSLMCMVSMPAMILGAERDTLNPSRVRRLTARWSCSTRLFKYFDWRNSMDTPLSATKLLTAAVFAPLLSIVIFSGTSCRSIACSKKRRAAAASRLLRLCASPSDCSAVGGVRRHQGLHGDTNSTACAAGAPTGSAARCASLAVTGLRAVVLARLNSGLPWAARRDRADDSLGET
jgi:putative transposase